MTHIKKSPLKWAGSKRSSIDVLRKTLPEGERLVEPFMGSGTVFLNLDYPEYLLSDINSDLINFFQQLKDNPEFIIKQSAAFFRSHLNNPQVYYSFRKGFNTEEDPKMKALYFLYLNRHCFNGLCRYNLKGEFNVAFGKYKKPYFPEKELYYTAERLQKATLICDDFESTLKQTKAGDVIYADPPYTPLEGSVGFTSYHGGTFGLEKHKLLLECLESTNKPFTISNHETNVTKTLYSKLNIHTFPVRRSISCVGDTRFQVNELVAYN